MLQLEEPEALPLRGKALPKPGQNPAPASNAHEAIGGMQKVTGPSCKASDGQHDASVAPVVAAAQRQQATAAQSKGIARFGAAILFDGNQTALQSPCGQCQTGHATTAAASRATTAATAAASRPTAAVAARAPATSPAAAIFGPHIAEASLSQSHVRKKLCLRLGPRQADVTPATAADAAASTAPAAAAAASQATAPAEATAAMAATAVDDDSGVGSRYRAFWL